MTRMVKKQSRHPFVSRWRWSIGATVSIFCLGYRLLLLDSNVPTDRRVKKQTVPFSVIDRNYSIVEEGSVTMGATAIPYLYQKPHYISDDKIRGLLFLAHGCSHSMYDWFENCNRCLGLPEELAIVQLAQAYSLAVVAVSSTGNCWSDSDGTRVAHVIATLAQKSARNPLIWALGASSGGSFCAQVLGPALKQHSNLQLQGFISEIAASPNAYAAPRGAVWITMNRDRRTDQLAEQTKKELEQQANVPLLHIRLPPLTISEDFFAQRLPHHTHYTLEQSRRMVEALRDAGYLDEHRLLASDPRKSQWRSVLRPLVAVDETLVADKSAVSEVLNAAYGAHEMTRDGVKEALEFLLSSHSSTL